MKKCIATITCPKHISLQDRSFFRRQHFRLLEKGQCRKYIGKVSERAVPGIFSECKKRGFRCTINDGYGERSGSYRKVFFDNTKPVFGSKYFCAYCGKLLRASEVTVDHIYPVGNVRKSVRLQKKLRRKGYESVNDYRNLCAACSSCNEKKGKKMKGWVARGIMGRHAGIWLFRNALLYSFLVIATAALFLYIVTSIISF